MSSCARKWARKALPSESPQQRPRALHRVFARRYLALEGGPLPPFTIQFYPYTDLKNTIRVRQGRVLIRISDVLRHAPSSVLSSLLGTLLGRLLKRPVSRLRAAPYRTYVARPEIREAVRRIRRRRGRKRLLPAAGSTYDLAEIFSSVNRAYFGGRLEVDRLGWSVRRGKRRLAHYDPAHDTIAVSRRLDDEKVPRFVLDYVLYHELLHVCFDSPTRSGRTLSHSRAFRRAEEAFPDFARARRFLEDPPW